MLAHAGGADETFSVFLLFAGLWVGWAGWSRLKGKGFHRLPVGGAYGLVAVGLGLAASSAFLPRLIFGPTLAPAAPPAAAERPASSASITFIAPTPGQMVHGDTLDVVMTLSGGTIVDAASRTLAPDTGHIHLSLDGNLVSMTYGVVQEVSLAGMTPGPHTLEAEFVAADHAPFVPRVRTSVTFDRGSAT